MIIHKKIGHVIASPFVALWRAFDIRDVFVFGGLVMLGYGIRLKWGDWLAFMICGTIILLLGLGFLTRTGTGMGTDGNYRKT